MRHLFELERVRQLVNSGDPLVDGRCVGTVNAAGKSFELYTLVIGTQNPQVPVFGVFGGVHGLERVGTHVALSWLESLFARLRWDSALRQQLTQARIIAMPLVNPGGMYLKRRSNPQGVDLMRNAPVDAVNPTFMVGGHRFGSFLPWYRGVAGDGLQVESQALCDFFSKETLHARAIITLDCHSGFGSRDRLWYPYARQVGGFPREKEALAISNLLREVHPHHVYVVEPQAQQYTTNGDLWDYLFDGHLAASGGAVPFVPWTLEMGSWAWVRKNPRQALTLLGPFNPMISHRYRRTMRRHLRLFDVLWSAVNNPNAWSDVA